MKSLMNCMPLSMRDRRPIWILLALLVMLLTVTLTSIWAWQSCLAEQSLFSSELSQREAEASAQLKDLSRRRLLLLRQKEFYEKLLNQWTSSSPLYDLVPSVSHSLNDEVTLHHLKSDGKEVTLSLHGADAGAVASVLDGLRHVRGFHFDAAARRDPAVKSGLVYIITGRSDKP